MNLEIELEVNPSIKGEFKLPSGFGCYQLSIDIPLKFSSFRKDLADVIVDRIDPIGKEMKKLIDDHSYLDGIMNKGKDKATYVADSVLSKVYDVVGFSKT